MTTCTLCGRERPRDWMVRDAEGAWYCWECRRQALQAQANGLCFRPALPRRLRSDYEVVSVSLGELRIRDLCRPGRMSLTNDMEAVVAELWLRGLLGPGVRLSYVDGMGRVDLVRLHPDGRFAGFAPGEG